MIVHCKCEDNGSSVFCVVSKNVPKTWSQLKVVSETSLFSYVLFEEANSRGTEVVTCLMLLVMNQTMKIREHTWTPVTITEVRTIPWANEREKKNSYIKLLSLQIKYGTFDVADLITYQSHNVPPERKDREINTI